jgi:hypothetical protein
MEKVSSAQINEYMVKAASAIRSQAAEIRQLKEKIASHDRRDHAVKIASLAVERGALSEDSVDEYAEHLAKGGEDLKMVEEFVSRSSRGLPLGKTLEKTASADDGQVSGGDVLTEFLLNSDLAR